MPVSSAARRLAHASAAPPSTPLAAVLRRGVVRTRAAQRPCPSLLFYPGLTARPWWALGDLPAPVAAAVARVAADSAALLAEHDALARGAPAGDYAPAHGEATLHAGGWTWHTAVARGRARADFALAAPRTVAALAAVPSLLLGGVPFAYSFFSSLKARAAIAPHFGPTNARLRVHVPLRVPAAPGAALVVAGEARPWAVGTPLVFDDAFEHAAKNDTDEERVVLVFDIWHPELGADERAAFAALFDEARSNGWIQDEGKK